MKIQLILLILFLLFLSYLKVPAQDFVLIDNFPGLGTDISYDGNDQYVTLKNGILLKNGEVYQTFQTNTANEQGLLAVVVWNDKVCVDVTSLNGHTQDIICDGITYISVDYTEPNYNPPSPSNHRGGDLVVYDGALYSSFGMGYKFSNSQNPNTYKGKIVKTTTISEEIVASGLRNPFRFDIGYPEKLFVADVGWSLLEEISIAYLEDNVNMGWPCYEGTHEYEDTCGNNLIEPAFEYDHSVGQSITGGVLYGEFYYFCDHYTGFGGKIDNMGNLVEEITFPQFVTSMTIHNDSLMVLTINGSLYSLFVGEYLGFDEPAGHTKTPPKDRRQPINNTHFNVLGQYTTGVNQGNIYFDTHEMRFIFIPY